MATKVGDVFAEFRLKADKAEADLKKFRAELKKVTKETTSTEKSVEKLGKTEKETAKEVAASKKKAAAAEKERAKAAKMAAREAEKASRAQEKAANKAAKAAESASAQAKKAGQGIARGMAIGTAAVLAAGLGVASFAQNWAVTVDEVGKAASKLKIPAQELQALEHAADLSGASSDNLRKSIQNLNKFITEGKEKGVTEFTKSLFAVGLGLKDIEGKTKTQQFGIISDELNKIENTALKATLQMKLFGEEAGPQLGNFTEQGSKGINKLVGEVEQLGGTLSKEALTAAAGLNDELARTKVVASGVANFVGTRLAPVIERIAAKFRKWLMANKALIASRLDAFLRATASAAARLLPQFIELAANALKLIDAVGGLEGALKAAIGGLIAFKLAFITAFGPVGPIAAAIVGVITLFSVLDSKLDQAARKVDRLVGRSLETSGLFDTGEFDKDELSKTERGRKLLRLESIKDILVKNQSTEKDIGSRTREETLKIRNDPGTADEFAHEDQQESINTLDARRRLAELRAAKILELQAEIDAEKTGIRNERLKASRNALRAQESKRREQEPLRAEFRKLAQLAITNKATPNQLKRLKFLGSKGQLDIDTPSATKSFFAPQAAGGEKDKVAKSPAELIQEALGGGGTLGIGGLTPSGPGTTINHNNFSINLAAPQIEIIIKNLPQNATPMDVAKKVKEVIGTTIQDAVRVSYDTQVRQVIG